MLMLSGEHILFMAGEAETTDLFASTFELKPHIGLMGIVAINTAILHGGMDHLLVKFFLLVLMTDDTEIRSTPLHLQGLGGTMGVMT